MDLTFFAHPRLMRIAGDCSSAGSLGRNRQGLQLLGGDEPGVPKQEGKECKGGCG